MTQSAQASPLPPQPRAPRPVEILAALATGGLLTLMLLCNSAIAAHTSPLFSSLSAHGVGTIAAILALGLMRGRPKRRTPKTPVMARPRVPLWAYLGGVSGAITVMLTSAAANSDLALTGTLALGLVGQVALALLFDRFGMMGIARRLPSRNDLISLVLIIAGTLLIIFARG